MSKNLPGVPGPLTGAIIVAISCVAVLDCSGASRGPQVMGPYLHPTLSRARRPLAALTPMPPPEEPAAHADNPEAAPEPRKAEVRPTPAKRGGQPASYSIPPLAANVDLRRSEVVRSANRLVGVRKSFDERSFLGHLLRINDMLPEGADPATFTAADYLATARASGRLAVPRTALPGDIVFFRCEKGCGYPMGDPIAAGIVERVYGDSLEFIAYIESRVRRCHSGARPSRRGTRAVDDVMGTVSIGR